MQFTQFNLQTLESTPTRGRFVIEPLHQGYGQTLGNSLRRVLYASIKGAAITQVQIKGVTHQFTTLEGMQEDMVQLILNLKSISLAYDGDEPVTIHLAAKGVGEVKAGDFTTPATVKIANPGLVVAHLTTKTANLEIEATVESGFGYSPAEERKITTVGVIPTDATFTPVVRVNYSVEATRVGRVTNFDKLILEIHTTGAITPSAALTSAAQILINYFTAIANPQTIPTGGESMATSTGKTVAVGMSVEELDLPTRITNALQKAGLLSVADIQTMTLDQLAKVKNLGAKSARLIEQALQERGLALA